MRNYLFLTGATGLIARFLLREFLQSGVPLAVLVRPQGGRSGGARLAEIMAELEHDVGKKLPQPVCFEGNISAPNLGLGFDEQRWLRSHCSRALHNAASVKFDGADPDH